MCAGSSARFRCANRTASSYTWGRTWQSLPQTTDMNRRQAHRLASWSTNSWFVTGNNQKYPPPPITYYWTVPLILDHAYIVGKLIRTKIADNKSVRILEVLKLSFQQFLNLWSSRRNISGPILGGLSNNRRLGGRKLVIQEFIWIT